MIKKMAAFALGLSLAVAGLMFMKPILAWATEEGSWLYHQFVGPDGPAIFYAGTSYTNSAGTANKGVYVYGGTKTTPGAAARFRGAAAGKPSSPVEGDQAYDTNVHSQIWYDGSNWWKLDITVQPPKWTEY